jgi:NTE family protein
MADYRVGLVPKPKVRLAVAVGASSAFPPVLSPVELELEESEFTPASGTDLQREPYTRNAVLSDGGVYDNLGLETVWKNYQTVLVSDAGGKTEAEPEPDQDWARHSLRVLNLIDNQVRSLRKRQVIDSFKAGAAALKAGDPGAFTKGARLGAYWGIRTDIKDYGLPDGSVLPAPHDRTMKLAAIPTRLKRLEQEEQERLINWGYAVTDAALRAHVDPALPKGAFPYPQRGV